MINNDQIHQNSTGKLLPSKARKDIMNTKIDINILINAVINDEFRVEEALTQYYGEYKLSTEGFCGDPEAGIEWARLDFIAEECWGGEALYLGDILLAENVDPNGTQYFIEVTGAPTPENKEWLDDNCAEDNAEEILRVWFDDNAWLQEKTDWTEEAELALMHSLEDGSLSHLTPCYESGDFANTGELYLASSPDNLPDGLEILSPAEFASQYFRYANDPTTENMQGLYYINN